MIEDLHRSFGVEFNNRTWQILEEGGPGPDSPIEEVERFLYRAYASAYHWMETPTATLANRARGEHLIARAAVSIGRPETARLHAERCLQLCTDNPDSVEDWDFAFAEEAFARALAAAGDLEGAGAHRRKAAELGEAVADEEDRKVFLEELAREPWFGLGTD